jgi:hypothetical protein
MVGIFGVVVRVEDSLARPDHALRVFLFKTAAKRRDKCVPAPSFTHPGNICLG